MKIRWLPSALINLQEAVAFIAHQDPQAGPAIAKRILDRIEHLTSYPTMGRQSPRKNVRELVISKTPFIVYYRIKDHVIEILKIHHHAKNWPELDK